MRSARPKFIVENVSLSESMGTDVVNFHKPEWRSANTLRGRIRRNQLRKLRQLLQFIFE